MHELTIERRTPRRTTARRRFPADPPRVEEIVAVMKAAGDSAYGLRLRALIVVLWRAGLRISEALALAGDPQLGACALGEPDMVEMRMVRTIART